MDNKNTDKELVHWVCKSWITQFIVDQLRTEDKYDEEQKEMLKYLAEQINLLKYDEETNQKQ